MKLITTLTEVIYQAILASQLTKKGEWRSAVKLMNR